MSRTEGMKGEMHFVSMIFVCVCLPSSLRVLCLMAGPASQCVSTSVLVQTACINRAAQKTGKGEEGT